jgi:hypothetical protein
MVWAASAGISTQKRPSKIKPDMRTKMIKALRRGSDKSVAARICQVSIESVTRLLRTEVGLSVTTDDGVANCHHRDAAPA